jgi:hypothetical protein
LNRDFILDIASESACKLSTPPVLYDSPSRPLKRARQKQSLPSSVGWGKKTSTTTFIFEVVPFFIAIIFLLAIIRLFLGIRKELK